MKHSTIGLHWCLYDTATKQHVIQQMRLLTQGMANQPSTTFPLHKKGQVSAQMALSILRNNLNMSGQEVQSMQNRGLAQDTDALSHRSMTE